MMHSFVFDGISSKNKGLIIKERNPYDGAERDVEYIPIPGANGDIIQDNGRYRNITITYTCYAMKGWALEDTVRNVKEWLAATTGYRVLRDTFDHNYFRMASYTAGFGVGFYARGVGLVPIAFNCRPMRYSHAGQKTYTLLEAAAFPNPEFFPSLPLVRVHGDGDGVLFVGDTEINITGIDGYIDLDSQTQNAHKGPENKNNSITVSKDDLPALAPGGNAISWAGNITKIEIVPRWCTL